RTKMASRKPPAAYPAKRYSLSRKTRIMRDPPLRHDDAWLGSQAIVLGIAQVSTYDRCVKSDPHPWLAASLRQRGWSESESEPWRLPALSRMQPDRRQNRSSFATLRESVQRARCPERPKCALRPPRPCRLRHARQPPPCPPLPSA